MMFRSSSMEKGERMRVRHATDPATLLACALLACSSDDSTAGGSSGAGGSSAATGGGGNGGLYAAGGGGTTTSAGGATSAGGSAGAGGTSAGGSAGSAPDASVDGPTSCVTACDCAVGEGCFAGTCQANFGVLCCERDCDRFPNTLCQSRDKTYGTCGADAGKDGSTDPCPHFTCASGAVCPPGCTTCVDNDCAK